MNAPQVPQNITESFALQVGKVMQNYGTIEYIVNEILTAHINDDILRFHLLKEGISKRLDLVDGFLKRDIDKISKIGIKYEGLIKSIKDSFNNRKRQPTIPL